MSGPPRKSNPNLVYNSAGDALDRNDLLSLRHRWTSNKKAMILDGLKKNMITLDDVKRVYNIDEPEIMEWRKAYAAGSPALRLIKGRDTRRMIDIMRQTPVAVDVRDKAEE